MSLNDPIAAGMSKILNAEKASKKSCFIKPVSKTMKSIFEVMKDNAYIGDFDFTDDLKGGYFNVSLLGKINNCGVIKPRFPVKVSDFQKYEKRYLPAKDFGFLIVSTSEGIMAHTEAMKKQIGGKLLAYIY